MESILLIVCGVLLITNGLALMMIAFLAERYKEMRCDYVAAHEALNSKK